MNSNMPRRDFLMAAPAAVGALAHVAKGGAAARAKAEPPPTISDAPYLPVDYPIRAKHFAEVKLKDAFWKPKVTANAEITIPFEVKKRSETARAFNGNVLQAAIFSLQTHPDPWLQEQVDARILAIKQAWKKDGGNNGFEVAAAYFWATGKRDLVEQSVESAAWLHEDFRANNPRFSGGERDAVNCLQLYRVTGDKQHLDLAKHYLDIRGLPNSLEPQPAQSVLQAGPGAERSRGSRGQLRNPHGIASGCGDANRNEGVFRCRSPDVARRGEQEDVRHRRRRIDRQRRFW